MFTVWDQNRELMRLLGDELRKFDRWAEEQNLMLDHDLYSDDDIERYKADRQSELSELETERNDLRNALKRAVRADDPPFPGGLCRRVDSQGHFVFRYTDDEAVFVYVNNNPEPRTLDWNHYREFVPGPVQGTDILSGDPVTLKDGLSIPPKSALIVQFNR